MKAIAEREAEVREIISKLIEPGPNSLQATLETLREFTITRLAKIRELISHPESLDLARAVPAEHFGTFMLEPTIDEGEPVYLAHAKVDFFGDEAMCARMVPGARIAPCSQPSIFASDWPRSLSLNSPRTLNIWPARRGLLLH